MTDERVRTGKLPDWAMRPFRDARDYLEETTQLLYLSETGIRSLVGMPELVAALDRLDVTDESEANPPSERFKQARRQAELAENEIKNGFPRLHAHAVVDLWAILEAVVRNVAVTWLESHEATLTIAAVQRVKITLAEYEAMNDRQERVRYLVGELDRATRASYKGGIGRFEPLLSILGLGGEVEADVRQDLYELHQVRNVIVHSASIADPRFVKNCPWIDTSPGEKLIVSREDVMRYHLSGASYLLVLLDRICDALDVPRPPRIEGDPPSSPKPRGQTR